MRHAEAERSARIGRRVSMVVTDALRVTVQMHMAVS